MKENEDEGEPQGGENHLDTRGQGEREVRFQERELSIWVGPKQSSACGGSMVFRTPSQHTAPFWDFWVSQPSMHQHFRSLHP